jgi:hypothetical protein
MQSSPSSPTPPPPPVILPPHLEYYRTHGAALFPMPHGSKDPHGIVPSFKHDCSRDPAQWERWQKENPGCNFGVVGFASQWIIVDIDTSGGDAGKAEAWQLWVDLCKSWGLPDALNPQVESARGGWHCYLQVPAGIDLSTYRQPDAVKGRINIRVIGYTVAAGSYYDGTAKNEASGPYTFFDNAPAPHPVPQALIDHCAPVAPGEGVAKPGDYDKGDVAKLLDWLNERDAFTAYEDWVNVGMALRLEFGDDGLALWARTHDDTVTPDVISTKWQSFSSEPSANSVTLKSFFDRAHKLGWVGTVRESVSSMFEGMPTQDGPGMALPTVASPPTQPDQAPPPAYPLPTGDQATQDNEEAYPTPPNGYLKTLGNSLRNFAMPIYIWDDILQTKFIYSFTAQTGTGKTAIAMLLALHVALGRALAGKDVEQGQVVYLAGENPTDVQMRWLGLLQTYKIDPDALQVHMIEGVLPLSKHADRIKAECEQKGLKPKLVIVDTAAAYNESESENDNAEMGDYARQLRTLCSLPGEPCVLVLCHPPKTATTIDQMTPRGGGSFLAEVDGNLGGARPEKGGPIAVKAVGKFRGPEFEPLHFATHAVRNVPQLVDHKGKQRATVIAQPVSEAGAAAMEMASETAEIRLLRDIQDHPGDSPRKRAPRLGCNQDTVGNRIKKLVAQKLVAGSGVSASLTKSGREYLNLKALSEGPTNAPTNAVPIPGGPTR